MRIAIDLTALLPEHTGVDNCLKKLVEYLGKVDEVNTYKVLVNYEDRHLFQGLLPGTFSVTPLSFRARPARLLFQQALLPWAARIWGADVVHSPSFLMPLYRGSQRHVLTVYDLTFVSLPHCHIRLRRSMLFRRAVLYSMARADLVTVPSHFTQRQILDLMPELPPERVQVIQPGIGEEFHAYPHIEVQAAVKRLRLPPSYILYVGTIEPRKNLERLVESYRRLVAKHETDEHLVLAGRLGWDYQKLLQRLDEPELRGRVHLPGYVGQTDLPRIYGGARLFVYPSLQEGFGFPPLEAMACGVPTISSLSSALAENLHGAADLVPSDDVEALTDAMRRMLQDEAHRAERRKQGLERAAAFRWEVTALRTRNCYTSVAEGH